jgi:hypothetical protein
MSIFDDVREALQCANPPAVVIFSPHGIALVRKEWAYTQAKIDDTTGLRPTDAQTFMGRMQLIDHRQDAKWCVLNGEEAVKRLKEMEARGDVREGLWKRFDRGTSIK